MPTYKYSARDKGNAIYEKIVETESRNDVYKIIREEGGIVIAVKEVREKPRFLRMELTSGISTQDKIMLARNLGSMIKAGLSLTRSLSVLQRQSKKKSLKKLLGELEAGVSRGETLSETLGRRPAIFSALFIAMAKAGEESGNLAGALNVVANQMEKSHQLAKKVRGALIYPAVILAIMVILAVLLLIFMVPTLTITFEGIGVELPLSTRIIIFLSEFLVSNTLFVFSLAGLILVLMVSFLRSAGGKRLWDKLTLRIPVIGELLKEVQSARTARTLSSLLSSGVEIIIALDVTIDVMQNHLYKETLTKARTAIEKGEPMSAIFEKNEKLYPIFVGEMVAVGEETGKISEMLLGVADYYEGEVDQKTKDLSTIIEPILMVVIGAAVAVFAISMLAPTYSLVEHI